MKNLLSLILIMSSMHLTFAQQRVWISVEDESFLPLQKVDHNLKSIDAKSAFIANIEQEHQIISVKKAFPASRNPMLQKVYEIDCQCEANELIGDLEKSGVYHDGEQSTFKYEPLYTPNDYNLAFGSDYALNLINAQEAWDIQKGSAEVVIGVSDTNFDLGHEELSGKVNYKQPNDNPNYDHGTAVAITAAGGTNNGKGKSSIGFNSTLALYAMSYNSLLQAAYDGIEIINISWAAECSFSIYGQALIDEVHAQGSIMVAAAGNGSTCGGANNLVYPAAYNHVIAVSSVGPNDFHEQILGDSTSTHQHNLSVDLCAPGYGIALSISNNNYLYSSGTSFAAPLVTGTIALMKAENPCLTPEDVEFILKNTAVDLDLLNPLYTGRLGAGRLDAAAAVEMASSYFNMSVEQEINNDCLNQTGSVNLNIEGGVQPINISWNNGQSGTSLQNVGYGTYVATITDSRACLIEKQINIEGPEFFIDYIGDIQINNANDLLLDENNDGEIIIQGSLSIADGLSYSLYNQHLSFFSLDSSFAGIQIGDDAKVDFDQVNFSGLKACESNWDGIRFVGGQFEDDLSEKGSPIIQADIKLSHCTIEDADIAFKNTNKQFTSILFEDVDFINNETSIELDGGNASNEFVKVKDCYFEPSTSGSINTALIFDRVEQVNIQGSEFNSLDPSNSIGLIALHSNLTIGKKEFNDDFLSKTNEFTNTFNHFYHAILAENSTLEVYGNIFENNLEAIIVEKFKNSIFLRNQFIDSIQNNPYNTFRVQSGDSILFAENKFFSSAINNQNSAIYLSNTDDREFVDIYKNEFAGNYKKAVELNAGWNSFNLNCNNFNGSNEFDLYIDELEKVEFDLSKASQNKTFNNSYSGGSNIEKQLFSHPNNETLTLDVNLPYLPEFYTDNLTFNIVSNEQRSCPSVLTSNELALIEIDKEKSFNIIPNPSNGQTTIEWGDDGYTNLRVLTLSGQVLQNIVLTQGVGQYLLSNLSSGVYMVQLSNDFDNVSKKLLVK